MSAKADEGLSRAVNGMQQFRDGVFNRMSVMEAEIKDLYRRLTAMEKHRHEYHYRGRIERPDFDSADVWELTEPPGDGPKKERPKWCKACGQRTL
jgi:hypothetical protein